MSLCLPTTGALAPPGIPSGTTVIWEGDGFVQAGARLPPTCGWSSTGREQVLGSPGLGTAVTAVTEAEFGVCATPPRQLHHRSALTACTEPAVEQGGGLGVPGGGGGAGVDLGHRAGTRGCQEGLGDDGDGWGQCWG